MRYNIWFILRLLLLLVIWSVVTRSIVRRAQKDDPTLRFHYPNAK